MREKMRPICACVVGAVLLLCILRYTWTLHQPHIAHRMPQPIATAVQQPWCPADFPTTPFPHSLWLVKTFKTGGSTLAGIFLAISAHYGMFPLKRDFFTSANSAMPAKAFQAAHEASDAVHFALVTHHQYSEEVAALFGRHPPLLFTSVRHPLARVHSNFVQHICADTARQLNVSLLQCSGMNHDTTFMAKVLEHDTVEARRQFAMTEKQKNHLYNYIRGSAETVQQAADIYNFIFVAERMDEGLVAFMLENGLEFEDIAYLSIKNRTGKYRGAESMPDQLNDLIISLNEQDLQLWQLANKRLDDAIIKLQQQCGRDAFASALATFKALQASVAAECTDYARWYTAHGYQPPYSWVGDYGVGLRCVRYAARRFMMAGHDSSR